MKRFYTFNAGCIRRGLDTIRIQEYLQRNGWKLTRRLMSADLIVIATCGVVHANEINSLRAIEHAARKKSASSRLVVTGCLPNINPVAIRLLGDFTLIPTVDIENIDKLVKPGIPFKHIKAPDSVKSGRDVTNYLVARSFCRKSLIYKALFNRFGMNSNFTATSVLVGKSLKYIKGLRSGHRNPKIVPYYNIAIARGCLSACAFCATKLAIGGLRSRPEEEILDEFKKGLDRGYGIFQLISEDTGCYGLDIGSSLPSLLRKLFSIEGNYKVMIIDYHPRWLISQYRELVPLLIENRSKVREMFIPVQSGSDRMLELMGRNHRANEIKAILQEVKEKAPCISLRTSLLIGFPGETEEDFEATKDFIRGVGFSEVTVNRYEDRPNTPSSKMQGKVEGKTIERRAKFLAEHMNCHILS
jgi:tRNA A37 methylthiotransferase MiaB